MAVATGTKIIPIVSSATAGPLGAIHLPRLWTKLTLGTAGLLPEDYDMCGAGFDQMTIDNLGLNRDKVIEFVRTKKPTYVQFEQYVRENGKTDPETIRKHNAAIAGYNHADDKAAKMRAALGLNNPNIKDAVTLNSLEDLHDLHAMVTS